MSMPSIVVCKSCLCERMSSYKRYGGFTSKLDSSKPPVHLMRIDRWLIFHLSSFISLLLSGTRAAADAVKDSFPAGMSGTFPYAGCQGEH
jgi:hypothetical protein